MDSWIKYNNFGWPHKCCRPAHPPSNPPQLLPTANAKHRVDREFSIIFKFQPLNGNSYYISAIIDKRLKGSIITGKSSKHCRRLLPFRSHHVDTMWEIMTFVSQLYLIQMHNYKGQLRRDNIQDHTPTKSSWDKERDQLHPQKQDPPYDPKPPRHEDKYPQEKYPQERFPQERYPQEKYQNHEPRYDTKFDKSELSYYQSQGSRVIYDYDHSEKPSTRSQAYLPDQKYLFNEVMNLKIKSLEREEYEQRARVQMQLRAEKGCSLLTLSLTDDANPKFLWAFAIREGDFMNLKHEQKLKVSYGAFPDMLKDCFVDCSREGQSEDKNNHLLLEIRKGGEGTLFLLESNRYKESVHLYLHFKLAGDEQLKDHLAAKFLSASEELAKAKSLISNLENTLSQRNYEFERTSAEFGQLRREGDKRVEQLRMEEKKKANEAESRNLNELAKVKRENELELKELKQKLGGEVEALSRARNELASKLSEARERIAHLESNEREQNVKIARLDQDVSKYLKEYESLKAENRELSDRRFHNEKLNTELSCRIQSLRSELEDKKTIISSTVQLKQTNSSQISSLETQAAEQRKQIIKLQTKITELQGEGGKVAAINAELLQKISRQKEKLGERGEIIKEQEKEIKELQKAQLSLARQNEELQYRTTDKDSKLRTLQEQLDIAQQKMQDETKLVMALQKSLNERAPLRTTSNYTGAYTPSVPYSGLNRQLPSQLSTNSNVSTSRVTSLNPPPTTNPTLSNPSTRGDKYEPNIRRYEQRSKSPLPKRLTQQKDPDEEERGNEKGFEQPRPIKFKMSQPSREE